MRMAGLEPARCYHRQILSLMRLPFRHIRNMNVSEDYSIIIIRFMQVGILISFTGGFIMNCLEAQKFITPFINNELDVKSLEDFLSHVNHCDMCKEELEVYNTLFTAMRLLDEDKNISNNFSLQLENKLKKAEERVVKNKIYFIRKKIILIATILAIGFINGVGIGTFILKDNMEETKNANLKNIQLEHYFSENSNQYLSSIYSDKYQKILYSISEEGTLVPSMQEGEMLKEIIK
jgi:hypothetical protein